MKLLIIGGTQFLGRHLSASAVASNHDVTLFNRGNHPSPPHVETIHGDRNTDLAKLGARHWDVVIDTCGMFPNSVRASAEFLSDSVDRYVYISSQSAYADVSNAGVKENAPLATLTTEQLEEASQIEKSGSTNYGKLYGGLKALCEQAAERAMPEHVLILRPGLIVGPDDYTDRFTYWAVRIAQGGEVLAPGREQQFVQFIDVRDLAEWIIRMVEINAHGIYNTSGALETVTMQELLEECRTVSQSDASFTWVSEEFLLKENVAAWSDMPLWLPEDAAPHLRGFMFIDSDKAVSAGLHYRPLDSTVRDTLEWYRTTRANEKMKAGIDRDREVSVLRKWREHIEATSHSASSQT